MDKWLRQAIADLAASRDNLTASHFEWACFQAQQAAEKALKAFLYSRGYTSIITHSLTELLREAEKLDPQFGEAKRAAHTLDAFYIPTRYPNGLTGELAPAEFFEKEDAEKCLSCAESILKLVKESTPNS